MARASAEQTLPELRALLEARFRDAVAPRPTEHGEVLSSGFSSLDAILPDGGLPTRCVGALDARDGAGTVSVVASFARQAVRRGEPVCVLDATAGASPHPFVEPADARAPLFVALPTPRDVLAALDITLRAGAFGLVAVLGLPPHARDVALRMRALVREREGRLLLDRPPAAPPRFTVSLEVASVEWRHAPIGSVAHARHVVARCAGAQAELVLTRDDGERLRDPDAGARQPDRRPGHGAAGRAQTRAGRR